MREKMQNEMLRVDSAESSAREGHTNALLQGVGQCAVPGLPRTASCCPKRHGVQLPPSAMERRLFTVAITKLLRSKIIEEKYWQYLGCSAAAAAQKETMNCISSAE